MSLQVKTFNAGSTVVNKLPRLLSITPPVNGVSVWNLDVTPLNISSSGIYTVVPNSAFGASVKMWGAGGAGVPSTSGNPAKGGGGGFASGQYTFNNHRQPYILVVGQGGWSENSAIVDHYTIGGGGGTNGASTCRYGGGMSALFTGSQNQSNAILIAGGGGAGTTYETGPYPFIGGSGGGTNAERGYGYNLDTSMGSKNYFGYGGTQLAGGLSALTNANAGAALLGGHGAGGSAGSPAGGGGGYFGGGGSGGTAQSDPGHGVAGSAGGGSGHIGGSVRNGLLITGVGYIPGNQNDSDRHNAGAGGTTSSFTTGSNGRVIIS